MSLEIKGRQISQALKKLDKKNDYGLTFNELRVVIALERAVARLEKQPQLAKHLVFKGGFVLLKITETTRFTHDLDALAFEISQEDVPALVEDALSQNLDDGLWFGDIKTEELRDQGQYGGLRFNCAYQIGDPPTVAGKIKKLSRIHIDVGFGDEIPKNIEKQKMASIIPEGASISWLVYPLEYVFSEKLQTLFDRASANSRAKDVYDLVLIFRKCRSKQKVIEAIQRTFQTRSTPVPTSFYDDAKKFDLTVLRSAWNGVQLAETKTTFDDHWRQLLLILQVLDQSK